MFAGYMFRREPTDSRKRGVRRPLRRVFSVAGLALLLGGLLVPAVGVGASSPYPPNTVVSISFDPRYGEVSVVTDAYGNLIDVNALTGQRIYPLYPDYVPGVAYANVAYTGSVPYYLVRP
jgi:hypothetical protein